MILEELQANSNKKKPTKLSPIKESKAIEIFYYRELKKLVNTLKKEVNERVIPLLKSAEVVTDSAYDVLAQLELIRNKFTNLEAFSSRLAGDVLQRVNQNAKTRFLNTVNSAFGVDISNVISEKGLSDVVALQRQKNKVLIKSIPEEFLKEVEMVVTNGLSTGMRHEAIAKQLNGIKNISSVFGKLENRVKMIARNETASINANINKARYESAGVDIYEWQSSEDERSRDSHDVLNGKYCTFKDATLYADTLEEVKAGKWKKRSSIGGINKEPGIDYNCRCNAIPIIE